MQTWEYGYLKFHTDELGRRAKLFFEGRDAERYEGAEADLLKILNRLGAEGWEAFSHTYDFAMDDADEDIQWMSILLRRPR